MSILVQVSDPKRLLMTLGLDSKVVHAAAARLRLERKEKVN